MNICCRVKLRLRVQDNSAARPDGKAMFAKLLQPVILYDTTHLKPHTSS